MSHYNELFQKCAPFQLNPPYQGQEISEIRGIALPQDYIDFLRLHNGGTFSNPNDEDAIRLVLFSLEEIIKGDCYRDEDGYWRGSARSQAHAYQNLDTQTVTTPNGVACEDSTALHQAFYDDHIVIGFSEQESSDSTPYVDLIAIDREGKTVPPILSGSHSTRQYSTPSRLATFSKSAALWPTLIAQWWVGASANHLSM